MRITQREGGDFAFDVGAVAYSSDIHFAREAGRDALHSGCGQGARQPMQWRLFFGISRKLQIAVGLTDVDALRNGYGQLAFRAFDQYLVADRDFHAFRQWNEFVSYSRHKFTCLKPLPMVAALKPTVIYAYANCSVIRLCPFRAATIGSGVLIVNAYHNWHSTSPPTCSLRAVLPVITPRGVVKMLIPRPPSTFGTSLLPTYTRQPGRETRSMREITGTLPGVYLR